MPDWITDFGIPAATFVLGLVVKHLFDLWGKRDDRRQAKREQQSKQKREAYLPFLKELESILVTEDTPPAESLKAAREKFVQIEIDGSDQIILASSMLLRHLEGQASGVKTSHDHMTPTYREYLLELVRSEMHGREPDLKAIEAKFLEDPLFALLAGIPPEPKPPGTFEVIFDYNARAAKKKAAADRNEEG